MVKTFKIIIEIILIIIIAIILDLYSNKDAKPTVNNIDQSLKIHI